MRVPVHQTTGPTIQILNSATFVDWQVRLGQTRTAQIRFALFDFDGTLSLLRAGWQQIMERYFTEVMQQADPCTPGPTHEQTCRDFISRLTGRQTIFQAMELARRVQTAGGSPLPAEAYKAEFLQRLHASMSHRLEEVRRSPDAAGRYLVPGSIQLLTALQAAGITCCLASGTDLPNVLEEAGLLGLSSFFADDDGVRIHGALPEHGNFSKRMVIEQIVANNDLVGPELVAFGDGYVEIEETRRAGGVTVAIASREDGGSGLDPWKAQRLGEVGAHILVADWLGTDELLATLGIA